MKQFFISYSQADRRWAEWIAWQLDAAGYTAVLQAWDFRPGSNFIEQMRRGAADAERTIAVLSPTYLNSPFARAEWNAALAADPIGEECKLVPVRVRECELEGMDRAIVYIDLVSVEEEEDAGRRLLDGLERGRAKPASPPAYPGAAAEPALAEKPSYPGGLPPIWNVPLGRNPNFTGREELLAQLRDALVTGQHAASWRRSAPAGCSSPTTPPSPVP